MATESGSAAGDQPETTGAPHPSAHASPSPLPTGTVTFLFTDIEGSTERWEHHRDAMRATLERHDAVVRGAIESHGGHVLKTVGDAFCAAFHTPLAAVAAALDAQRAVAAEDWSACGADFAPLRVRIGIHTGVAQERGGDYFGPAVNRTARLEAAGHGGQVLMSLATQQLVQGDLPADCTVRDWGTHRLKDLRYADRIFQVVGPGVADVATPPRTATALAPRDRVVFSCRTLDYSAPLSTPALRVSQVQIEPMSDRQVEEFLTLYSPVRGADIWAAIRGTPQIDALRAPFFLALLVDQVESTGEIAGDRAGLFTGFVRQALRREVERGSPLFALEELLSGRDVRRIAQWQWRDAYELPERGALVPRLSALAYGMQETEADGEASQVRVDYDAALEIVDDPRAEDIVKAGVSIAVLDEDPAADEVLYRHQLIQEYFAARVLAREPRPELTRAPWRASEIRPTVRELLETLPPAETLPALPTTGWEETTVLAAAMTADPAGFVRGVMATNLALAGRCAAQPMVAARLPAELVDGLRWALVARSRDASADLRARIDAGLALGWLSDPRFERRVGPHGEYLVPPMVAIVGGAYPIGEDEPIFDPDTGEDDRAHMPRHSVALAGFAIGQFPVTNAEYACFMAAGGYDDERWWDTEAGRAWRRGESTAEGRKQGARDGLRYIKANPHLVENWHDSGQIDDDVYERWLRRLAMTPVQFEAHLTELYPGGRETMPAFWQDQRHNNPGQPVVGISWFEARAYAAWLTAQTGRTSRLPTEAEWEAAARGTAARRYAYGDAFDAAHGNTLETHLRRPTPVGVFAPGDTPDGISDLAGNVTVWTSSLWGEGSDAPDWKYPYHAADGREEPGTALSVRRVVQGGSWNDPSSLARAAFRGRSFPDDRGYALGVRLASSAPIPGGH